MFEGVDLLETLEHLSIPSYAVDRRRIIRWVNQAARVAAGGHAAVIVIGSRGLTGMKRIFDASVSQQVAEHAGRPVLIVAPPR